MAYAIFKTGGKRSKVAQGDVIEVEKLGTEAGKEATFSDVLFYGSGDNVKLGDALKKASVVAEVLEHVKDKKVIAYKFRRRKGYHRTVGHRRQLTRLKITSITA